MGNCLLINVQFLSGQVILARIILIADCRLTLPELPHSCFFLPYLLLLVVHKLLIASDVVLYSEQLARSQPNLVKVV